MGVCVCYPRGTQAYNDGSKQWGGGEGGGGLPLAPGGASGQATSVSLTSCLFPPLTASFFSSLPPPAPLPRSFSIHLLLHRGCGKRNRARRACLA